MNAVNRLLGFAVVIVAAAYPLGSSEFECLAWKDMESASLELQCNYISNQTVSYLQSQLTSLLEKKKNPL